MEYLFGQKNRFDFKIKYILSVILVIFMISSSMLISSAETRSGNMGNQPTSGYSEGGDIFEIYHSDNTHNTAFDIDETVNIRLTTNRVQDLKGKNNLIVRSSDDNKIVDQDPAFTQVSSTSPYVYEASFTASSQADHYLVEAEIEDDGGEIFRVYDTIIVGNGGSPMKYIRTYSDSEYTNVATTFVSYATVYVEVFHNVQPSQQTSRVDIRDYQDNKETKNIRNLKNPTLTWHQDNYARFAFNLKDDVPWTLNDGYWYILSGDIRNNAGTDICKRWSIQILIKRPPDVSSGITTANSPVDVIGSNSVTITSKFTNPEVISASSFKATFKIREPNDNTEILLVNQKSHGGSGELGGTLSLTLDTSKNIYTASYSFDPDETWVLGDYDLYFSVENNYGEATDGYNRNGNELNLFDSTQQPPHIEIGITTCIPSSVDVFGTGTVTIYSEFTDAGNTDVSSFTVTFKIKQSGQPSIDLVKAKANGGPGEFGDTVSITYMGGVFTASYTWDPDGTFPVGTYDLFFEVDDGVSGNTRDGYDNNRNELVIINSDNIPSIKIGSTTALPSSVDKIGKGIVTIYSEFTDDDMPDASTFMVTFKVRAPDNTEIVLANDVSKGGLSEFGDTVSVEFSGTVYTASVTWDPDESVLTGFYDLQFEVWDGNRNYDKDGFGDNNNELQIISSVNPPKIEDVTCIPSSVSKIGEGTTNIYSTFTDEKYSDLSNFTVSFKVRAPDDTVYNLTVDAGNGDRGEYGNLVSISFSGTVYTASYVWNPPDDVPVGDYDLYSSIKNDGGGIAVNGFGENRNELKIETTENPPEIDDTRCIPASLSVIGTAKTQLFVTFTDKDNPAISEYFITFKLRDEDNNEITVTRDLSNGAKNTFGESLNITYSGTEYTASIFWDPKESALSGKYDLYSSILEKTGALIVHGFDKNKDELTLTDGAEPGQPTLTDSFIFNSASDEYNVTVTYTDSENDPPNDDGVILKIGSKTFQMIEADPNDEDYTDGKDYYYALKLDEGQNAYSVKVTNTEDEVYETKEKPFTEDPVNKSSDSKSKGSSIAIILLIIIIIAVIILLMVFRKKKKPTADTPEPAQKETEISPAAETEVKTQENNSNPKETVIYPRAFEINE